VFAPEGERDALPILRKYRDPGEGLAPGRGPCGDPAAAKLSRLRARRENFDRDKLSRSIRIAMQKRPVEPERIEQMISGIVRRLESMGDTDIPSDTIGEIVMETLARIDSVAYVRFASVYKNFQEADDFEDFVADLRPPTEPPADTPSGD
jgi:transcriptional regulator NrdR family protein